MSRQGQSAVQPPSGRPDWRKIFQDPRTQWQARDALNEVSARAVTQELRPVRSRGHLQPGEVGVICVLRNEAARLRLFFDHYKKLGVDRFFVVDNASTDGSAELLLAEPLADVFWTDASYYGSYYGINWFNGIAQAYCRGNWIVMADADELLVYDGMERHGIKDLSQWLAGQGCDRIFTPMIDLYASGIIGERQRDIAEILAEDCWFDVTGYRIDRYPAGWILSGGPRERLFNSASVRHPHWISKYPFLFVGENTVLFDAHFLWPWDRKYRGPEAAFLHLKLLDDFIERCAVNVLENQHAVNSRAYRIITDRLAENPVLNAMHIGSKRYTGAGSLIEGGLLLPIDWQDVARPEVKYSFSIPPGNSRRDWLSTLPGSGLVWRDRDEYNGLSRQSLREHLEPVRCRGPLAQGEIGAICVLRNEAERLPLIFDHYKQLGVDRFFMVDNQSDDGSHELLLAEPSADIFIARASFNEGQGGLYWANGLAREYCRNNWIVRTDADELLIYDGMDKHGLGDLAGWLSEHGRDRLFALMLDLYPSNDIGTEQRSVRDILVEDSWFDSEGYSLEANYGGWLVTGGPRQRLLGQNEKGSKHWLSKFPFFLVTDETAIVDHHWIWPMDWKQQPPSAALLHLKLMGDFIDRSARFEREGQHAFGSKMYREMNRQLANKPSVTLFSPDSRRYRGPKSLIRYRVMQSIDWGA